MLRTVLISALLVAFAAALPKESQPVSSAKEEESAVQFVTLEGCSADDRLCFVYPDKCLKKKQCTMALTIRKDPAKDGFYRFDMAASFDGFVSVALCEGPTMANDSVVECVLDADREVRAYQSVNIGGGGQRRGNRRLPKEEQGGVELLQGVHMDGAILCTFRRKDVTEVDGKTYDILNAPWFIQVAAGNKLKEGNVIGHHNKWFTTKEKVSLSKVGLIEDITYRVDKPQPSQSSKLSYSLNVLSLAIAALIYTVK